MGDVCGKGTEAAKVTALARYTLRAEATQHLSPAVVLTQLNRALLDQRGGDRFLTAVYATFRTTRGGMAGRLCTAGDVLLLYTDGTTDARAAALPAVPPVNPDRAGQSWRRHLYEQASPRGGMCHVYRHWNGRPDCHHRPGHLDATPPLTAGQPAAEGTGRRPVAEGG
ncbi:MAG TPA: SpoIIE family protein phosphatase [Streptosporangiaceae bacterium]|nr:SpoIIE family protein phosphatase [Streptosporangiaceae bacterium]